MIWDEKLGTDLPENTLLQLWRSELKDNQCADYIEKGGQIVVSYGPYFYFDYDYSQTPLKKTYSYTNADIKFGAELEKGIFGIEGTVWTEWIRDKEKLDFTYILVCKHYRKNVGIKMPVIIMTLRVGLKSIFYILTNTM